MLRRGTGRATKDAGSLVDEATFSSAADKELFGRYTMCFPEGEMMLAYPVPGRDNDTRPGRRSYNHIWYRPTDGRETLPSLPR